MAYSYSIVPGNGSQTQFNVPFDYIRKEHIVAYVNYTLTSAFTWVNASTIQFTTAPGAGVRVEIRRLTPLPNNLVDYTDGSTLVAADLDTSNNQHLYKEQELDDDIKQSVYVDPLTGFPTASNQRITNVANPTSAQDAATKSYVDTTTVASAGDSMTGPLAMGTNKITGLGDPAANQDAATKAYVDSTTVASAGDSMTGPLAMGASKITGLGDPTSAQDAATKAYVDSTTWNNTTETIDSTETWVSTDAVIGTTGATAAEMDVRHDTLVQTSTPSGSGWRLGKTWLQNDVNKTLSVWNGSAWLGVASGGTFTTQPTVIYVDATNGNDADDGHRIINPKKTIKAAVTAAAAGDIIKVAPGVYQEILPIDITVTNLSIVGEAQRSCFIHPTVATEQQSMFRCNSGTYIDGFTFAGLKASGTRGGHYVDTDATYGLPTNQGWVASFYPGCTITKSPYVNNCTNFADSGIDNSSFNPNNHGGTGGDTTSAPTGGGILVDGSVPNVNSPLRSFVINEFTQINLDGPGLLVCNNGYVQAVSFFGIFCHYHAKALSGGQINMEVGTTNFGRYGLIADGKSSTAIFTATANGAASTNATTFAINAPTAAGSWFGDATRPALNMLVQVGGNIYPILSATANGAGWDVAISRPNPNNKYINLGLVNGHSNGAAVSFFLRSMISTAAHTHEYTGAGTSYTAMPENGGVPLEANEAISRNDGRVWLTSVDQNGKFKVGDTFVVDQQTGFVSIEPGSITINNVSDGDRGDITVSGANWTIDAGAVTSTKILDGAVGDAKLAQITTAGKVSGTAITSGNISTTGSFTTTSTLSVQGLTFGKGGGAGSSNTAAGVNALISNTTGLSNTAVGCNALQTNTTGVYNTAIGSQSLLNVVSGNYSTAVGTSALSSNINSDSNTAIGSSALYATTSPDNTAVGAYALMGNTTGSGNVAVGMQASQSKQTGDYNTTIGRLALWANVSGSNNVGIGYNVASSTTTISNEVNITNGTVTARFQGAAAAWTFVSDARDKTDIENLALGLDFITALKPRKFKWNLRNTEVDRGKPSAGFIAQEVLETVEAFNAPYTNLIDTNDLNQYTFAQANMIPMLVKAIQELAAKVEALENSPL